VPPSAALQLIPGVRHTRGTLPAVVELRRQYEGSSGPSIGSASDAVRHGSDTGRHVGERWAKTGNSIGSTTSANQAKPRAPMDARGHLGPEGRAGRVPGAGGASIGAAAIGAATAIAFGEDRLLTAVSDPCAAAAAWRNTGR
jgi:hypothetical protein